MARLPIPPVNPNNRIPNNPFYAPNQNYLQGEFGPFVIGSGLSLDLSTGVLNATGGVAGLVAGTGIDIVTGGTPPGSTATISNLGVLSVSVLSPLAPGGTAQNPIISVNPASTSSLGVVQLIDSVSSTSTTEAATPNSVRQAYAAALAAVQTVSVTAPITVSGASTNPTIGVDLATTSTTGVVSVGSNLSVSPAGQINVATASTSVAGIVQLNNTTSSTLTTQALTAAQGKFLQQQIDALLITNNITLAGTYDASTGFVDSVTPEGAAASFVVGSPLPAPATTNEGYFVIIDVEGSNGPSGTPPYHIGDWFLSSGTAWQFLNVGFQPPYATTTTAGVVELSDNAETQAGSDATLAVTPASLQSKLSDSVSTTSSTTIASSTAVKTAYALAAAAIPCSIITARGDLIVGSPTGTPVAVAVGGANQVLYANPGVGNGVCWGALPSTPIATPTIRGILFGCSGGNNTSVGANALKSLTTGGSNTAVGLDALCSVTTAVGNTALGDSALASATGCQNTAIGGGSMFSNASGICNTALGFYAMIFGTGSCNVALGPNSLRSTSGDCNVAIGITAGSLTTSGNNNVIIGPGVQAASATGSCQLAIGFSAADNWLTGDSTRNIRPGAGIVDCTASAGTAGQVLASNGSNAVCWRTIGDATPTVAGLIKGCTNNTVCNTFLGCSAGSTTAGTSNTLVGYQAGTCLNGGTCNIAVGVNALRKSTNGARNITIGYDAACNSTTADENIAIGWLAGCSLISGSFNIAIGTCALSGTNAAGNIAIGEEALSSPTLNGGGNLALGRVSLPVVNGLVNTGVGCESGYNLATGNFNTFVGPRSGELLTSGSYNLALGACTNFPSNTGDCQLAIGFGNNSWWLTGNSTKAIRPGAGIIDSTGSCGTAGQVLASTGSNSIVWATSTAPSKLTATKSLTNGTPIDLLSWSTGVRMGDLSVFATDNSTTVKWANITVGSVSGIGSTAVITQSVGVGNFTIVAGGSGETIVRFTPSVTLANVNFVYQYNAAFGSQPSVL